MKKIGSQGFTLVELIATLVLLSIIMGIGTYSITTIINNSKEKDYELLVKEIVNATEVYYQECRFSNHNCDSDSKITLDFLISQGYLKGNSTIFDDVNDKEVFTIVNPKDNKNISSCIIEYEYTNGKIKVTAVNPTGSCPRSY